MLAFQAFSDKYLMVDNINYVGLAAQETKSGSLIFSSSCDRIRD